jgi:tetratricopeptide (TPR) repeat protein
MNSTDYDTMLHRTPMRTRIAAALAAALLGTVGFAWAGPAEDLKEAQKLYASGRVQPAMDKVDAVLKAQPKDPQARFLKGLLLTEQKKTAEAIQVFTGLTEDYPELPEPYNNLAVLYAQQGNYDKAKAALELAIHTHPSYATAHENLGDIYAQLASRAYDRALQLDKNNAAAQVKLAMVKDLFTPQKGSGAARPAPKVDTAPKTEPAKTAAASRPEPVKTEPAKPAPPKAEPAKAEPPAKVAAVEPKASPKTVSPAKAGAQSDPVPSPAPAGARDDDKAKITAAVEAWARAWSSKNVAGYLAAYAPEFEVPGGEGRAAWEKQRTERIEKPKSIEVGVKVQSVEVDGNKAKVVLRQAYRSDTLKNTTTKTLGMIRSGDRWLITQEKVGG